jgi:hypothetical protein
MITQFYAKELDSTLVPSQVGEEGVCERWSKCTDEKTRYP